MDRTSRRGIYRFESNACVENEFDGWNNNDKKKKRDRRQLDRGVKT